MKNIYFHYRTFIAMSEKVKQEQTIDKLKKLQEKKNLPNNIKQSIAEKQQQVKTPFNK